KNARQRSGIEARICRGGALSLRSRCPLPSDSAVLLIMPRSHDSSYQRMYRFPSGVTLRLQTDQREVLGHLDAEYGSVSTEALGEADIDDYADRNSTRLNSSHEWI